MERRKIVYFVLGPESTGTRLAARILIAGGAAGDDGHEQRFDQAPFEGDRVVLRRSLPHRHEWVRPEALVERALAEGYLPFFVGTTRERKATIASQLRIGHVRTAEQAEANIILAEGLVGATAQYVLRYEDLVRDPVGEQQNLWRWAGLDWQSVPIDIYDGNHKYNTEN